MSCAESVKYFLRVVTSDYQNHKPDIRWLLGMLWSCLCAHLGNGGKSLLLGLLVVSISEKLFLF